MGRARLMDKTILKSSYPVGRPSVNLLKQPWAPTVLAIPPRLLVCGEDRSLSLPRSSRWTRGRPVSQEFIIIMDPKMSWQVHSRDRFQIPIREGCLMSHSRILRPPMEISNQSRGIWINKGRVMRRRIYSNSSTTWTTWTTQLTFKTIIITRTGRCSNRMWCPSVGRAPTLNRPRWYSSATYPRPVSSRTSTISSRWTQKIGRVRATRWGIVQIQILMRDKGRCTIR